jgi:hypothetical protein
VQARERGAVREVEQLERRAEHLWRERRGEHMHAGRGQVRLSTVTLRRWTQLYRWRTRNLSHASRGSRSSLQSVRLRLSS